MSHLREYLLMLAFIAFAVKMPVVPLHGWLPDAHSLCADRRFRRPSPVSFVEKLPLRSAAFLPAIAPNVRRRSLRPSPCGWGVIGIFYGAWDGLYPIRHQAPDCLYLRFPHGLSVLIAILPPGSLLAYRGAVIQMIAMFALSAAGLFILCGRSGGRTFRCIRVTCV